MVVEAEDKIASVLAAVSATTATTCRAIALAASAARAAYRTPTRSLAHWRAMAGRRRPWPCSKAARSVITSGFRVRCIQRRTSGATSDQTTRWRALATSGPTSPNRREQGGARLITPLCAGKARFLLMGPCLARRTGGAGTSCCVFPPAVASTGRVRFPSENASRTKSKMGYADPYEGNLNLSSRLRFPHNG